MAYPQLVTPASTFPVTLAEAKAQCGIEDDSFDRLLETYIAAAADWIEQMTGRALMASTWRLTLDAFSDEIELAVVPVIAVAEVGYFDLDGLPQAVDPAVWSLDLVSNPAYVVRNADAAWPEVLAAVNAVWVEFTAGYASAAAVPAPLRLACLALVCFWFENRTPGTEPPGIWTLIGPFRRVMI